MTASPDSSGNDTAMTLVGGLFVLLLVGACFAGAYYLFFLRHEPPAAPATTSSSVAPAAPSASGETASFGIAYGTEKKRWLRWAAAEFAKHHPEITVNLIPRGSREGAQEVLDGNEAIHVWSPASALYTDYFRTEWEMRHGGDPILQEERLALSPMVFVFWEPRYEAFREAYEDVSFKTLGKALRATGGWGEIARKPDWGLFKFGHTHPGKSNSGGVTLILMAYDYHDKTAGLTVGDIVDPGFQQWMSGFERAASNRSHSTGTLMKEMVLKGPSTFDALSVYENLAIDYLKSAAGRWGRLTVTYPRKNMWNDNPYYILDVPWSGEAERRAAATFLAFLMSEPVQKQALQHGFRPGNPAVPVKFPESPLVKYADHGLRIDLTGVVEAPKGAVVENLLASWQRATAGR